MISLFNKTFYTIDSDFIISPIYEYDIEKANISILLKSGVINIDQYWKYYNMTREERQIKIGLLQRSNHDFVKILDEGFKKARSDLSFANDIQDDQVISIKKDSMFVTKRLYNIEFGPIKFIHKNTYCFMIRIRNNKIGVNIEIYFGIDNGEYIIDVKGISDEKLELHRSYIQFLCELFDLVSHYKYSDAVKFIMSFNHSLINKSLPIEFYREFNSNSMFKVLNNGYYLNLCYNDSDKQYLDITTNVEINREIYRIISAIYMTMSRKPKLV